MKKLTYEEVKEYIESFGYELLNEEYMNANTKLKIKCSNGHIFERTFSKFKQTQACPYCTKTRKWTVEEIREYLNNIGYTLISNEYKNNQTKLDIICSEGHKVKMTFGNIQQGKRCHICSRKISSEKKKHTYNFVKEYIEKFGYKLLSEKYIDQDKKIKIKCPEGHIFKMSFYNFKRGRRCPECCKNKKITHEEFIKKFHIQNPNANNIEILGTYVNSKTKIKCRCRVDKYEWETIPSVLLNHKCGCPKCSGNIQKSHEEFIKDFIKKNISANEIEVLEEYKNSHTKIKCKCRLDGYEWEVAPSNLLNGTGCPKCNESKGEKRIAKYLKENNIKFKPQKKFNDLLGVGSKQLSYDFYLPKYNLLIEFQGEQHERCMDIFHATENDFKKQQEHDKRKREYAEEHNIELLEIWYWDYDKIENILSQELNINK